MSNTEIESNQVTLVEKARLLDALLARLQSDKTTVLWENHVSMTAEDLVARLREDLLGTQTPDILADIDSYLQTACGYADAGFYFEEGGCFGMAAALHELFTREGLAPEFAYSQRTCHAMVKVGNAFYDYRGEHPAPSDIQVVSKAEFQRTLQASGFSQEQFDGDRAYAEQAIGSARELAEDARTGLTPLPSKEGC